jgi:hypothetical protein
VIVERFRRGSIHCEILATTGSHLLYSIARVAQRRPVPA